MNIEANKFFSAFNEETRKRLIALAVYETYADGAVLFEQDDISDGVYLVLSGQVELTRTTHNGQVIVLARVPEGEYFGEMGVIDSCGRSTGALTKGETRIAKIPASPLMDILRGEPGKVSLHFVRRLSDYLRQTNSRFIDEMIRKEKLQVIGEMASSIIHDFSNPMASIQIAAEVISRQSRDKKLITHCRLITQQVERMSAMAQELLDYSRGQLQLVKGKVTVNALFENVELLNAEYLRKNKVALCFQPVDATIEVDMNRIMRVFQNLLSNAVEALGHGGGAIHIQAVKPDKRTVELSVRDNGPGIPENIRDTIFEPFVTEGKRQGTGLGMAIAKKIIEAHAGIISFITETGKGTTFIIRLPIAS